MGSYGRNRVDLENTLLWAGQGKLKPAIDKIYSLAETANAFAQLRDRAVKGKVLVKP